MIFTQQKPKGVNEMKMSETQYQRLVRIVAESIIRLLKERESAEHVKQND